MATKAKQTSLIPEKLQFIADLGRTSSWIANRYTVYLKPFGISPQQLNILRVLRSDGDWLAMNEVNEQLIVKSPNVTRLADKLVSKRLIDRERSEDDRRVVYLRITKEGLKLLGIIDQKHEHEWSDYMDTFSTKEAIMMTKILKRIRE